ncbi:uroporphyrin-III C-methyltransferase / precorrin-2 dehydrogenase / sirohydrochlorin ferrochelatase [Micromonospora phaseoli]|uniref:Uroporphyrin-III C-methyltransferase / precorrin-2 dehydrogenase / sirohydrochlorin ferrochelatase n=1 Tax=Micromonospora phaseoli TaxID=1144548 RepID=A0A1H6W3V3_9ACTN|nr:uroporphyrinogen-III C-methyltransferase [Micromonospora phaseoli]PZW01637.1 uroporphyrin-III C-methyltransferase/precorrin-2 dehydrogenase/sirohydrochlorin ferrochelatase [Micromonospora phaseoli]GIJ80664.1 uroporphyrinogen-III C-methyltransferase [Micromonospora phaseoli]SEJ11649.1 uroporphyrin-III C-methyltransferase / precorrin-2 dehydrogenase / sirohydrochlorin ferrochelatase [Micromonospora phaseoli]
MSANPYPLGLWLAGLRAVVVGGGAVATRRVPALLDAGADVLLVTPELTPALRAHADAGRLRWVPRRFVPDDLDGAWLVQVAVDDPAAAAEVSSAAAERQIFCVRADDRRAATAWTPAVTRYGPVTVAVLGGGDPRRAVTVRDAIRTLLHERTGPFLSDSVEQGPPVNTRSAVDVLPGRTGRGGRVALVGAGPGDPELITLKGWRLLTEADVVVADRLVPGLLLDELRSGVELVDASKIPYGPSRAQEEINQILVDRALAGAFVVRLKGGDPYVFGRGGEELLACAAAGVPVTVVPGVTSSIAAPAAAGIPVTHRAVAHEFTVVSGHVAPDSPDSLVRWDALAGLRGTLVILMGLRNLPAITATLLTHGRPADTPVAVVQEATTGAQRIIRSTLGEVAADTAAAGLRPPAVVVVGDVVVALGGLLGTEGR